MGIARSGCDFLLQGMRRMIGGDHIDAIVDHRLPYRVAIGQRSSRPDSI